MTDLPLTLRCLLVARIGQPQASGMFTKEQRERMFEIAKQEVAKFKADFVQGKCSPP